MRHPKVVQVVEEEETDLGGGDDWHENIKDKSIMDRKKMMFEADTYRSLPHCP